MALRQVQEILGGHVQGRSSFGIQKLHKRNNTIHCGPLAGERERGGNLGERGGSEGFVLTHGVCLDTLGRVEGRLSWGPCKP